MSGKSDAQWQMVFPKAFVYGGAVCRSSPSTVWVGLNSLYKSTDFGRTWIKQKLSVLGKTIDYIEFLDSLNGLVSVYLDGVWRTTDGGESWTKIFFGGIKGFPTFAGYGYTPEDIVVVVRRAADVSHDGGLTWSKNPTNIFSFGTIGRAFGLTFTLRDGQLRYSPDLDTWTVGSGKMSSYDTYSIGFESCTQTVVAANENYYLQMGNGSALQATTDLGRTWNTLLYNSKPGYIVGAVALGRRAIYCPTLTDGVLRSLDFGKTWKSIGGPNGVIDAQCIAALNDNVLIAMDVDGNIWRTENSGGDSVHVETAYHFTTNRLFDRDTLSVCDSPVVGVAWLKVPACENNAIVQSIAGPDSQYFSIVKELPAFATGYDSVAIAFHADSARDYHATFYASLGLKTLSISLTGHGRSPVRVLAVATSVQFDTVSACSARTQSLQLKSSSCSAWTLLKAFVSGVDSFAFSPTINLPRKLAGSDTIPVLFSPDSNRSYHATLTFILDDSTIRTIDLYGSGSEGRSALSFKPQSLFGSDTSSACEDPIKRVLFIEDTGCISHAILNASITGVDADHYSLITIPSKLPDSLSVLFVADSARQYHANLELLLSDSSRYSLPLNGFGKGITHSLSITQAPSFKDSVSLCGPASIEALHLSDGACRAILVQSISLSDSNHFRVIRTIDSIGQTDDSVLISFHPDSAIAYKSTLTVTLSDTVLSFPLEAFGKLERKTIQAMPTTLFVGDTIPFCEQRTEMVIVQDSSCRPRNVLWYAWLGADSGYYHLSQMLPTRLNGLDTLAISFIPDSSRSYLDTLKIGLDDGSTLKISLAGIAKGPNQLTFESIAQTTNVIGGDVSVPLTFKGLVKQENLEVVLHYSGDMDYSGTYDSLGNKTDLAGEQWSGRSKLSLQNVNNGSVAAWARFNVFSDSVSTPIVSFDSVVVLSMISPCEYLLPDKTSNSIISPSGCGFQRLSQFLHGQIMPLTIGPNPTKGTIKVESPKNIGEILIEVFDIVGTRRKKLETSLSSLNPFGFILEGTEGLYFVRIVSQFGEYWSKVILEK